MKWPKNVYPSKRLAICALWLMLCFASLGCAREEAEQNRPAPCRSTEGPSPTEGDVQSPGNEDNNDHEVVPPISGEDLESWEDDWKDKQVSRFGATVEVVESDQDFIRIIHSHGGAYHGHNESWYFASNYGEVTLRRDTLYKIDKSAVQIGDLKAALRHLYQSHETAPPPEQVPSNVNFTRLLVTEGVVRDQSWEWGK